ncbi:MAG: F0F1 ATP synthase subunit A [Phycisphaerae bacterium]|nr:F0F1 ATP synthase subunit A [Phycisphaerae bacterium]
MLTLAAHDPVDHVLPHRFFQLLPTNLDFGANEIPLLGFPLSHEFYFTNQLLMTLVAALLCLLIFPWLARAYAGGGAVPNPPRGSLMNLFEALLQFIREEVARPVLKHRTDRFMPFLWTLFFFILFCNLLGLIPLADIIRFASGGKLQNIGGTATGNLAITGGLALCAFLMIHGSGVQEVYRSLVAGTYGHHGHEGDEQHDHAHHNRRAGMSPALAVLVAFPLYVWNFAPHVFKPAPGSSVAAAIVLTVLDVIMWLVLLLLELIGAVIKPFALMIRLFANMVAGHIVLGSILLLIFTAKSVVMGYTVGAISTVGCVALNCLELFVAFLQAYIFVFLTTLFISMAVAPEH